MKPWLAEALAFFDRRPTRGCGPVYCAGGSAM
jgi:hypothetical protein